MGAPVWEGKLDIANDLNKEVTTSFPVDEALPDRKPGVYVLTAQPENDKSDDWQSRATQWFVVSDIGLTTYTGQDGLNVFARSLATAKPMAGVDLTLLASNNEILGTAKTDAERPRHLHARPDARRRRHGAGRADGQRGDSRLRLPRHEPRRLRPVRSRRRRARLRPARSTSMPGPNAASTASARHVHVGALARDAAAKAVENLPLTFIFTRPDGVEDRRIVSDGKSAGGHAVDLDLSEQRHARHLDGRRSTPIRRRRRSPTQMFLVEDFVPDRIEFDLTADKKEIAAGEPPTSPSTAASSMARRPPASRSRARSTCRRPANGSASTASSSALPTSRKATPPAFR